MVPELCAFLIVWAVEYCHATTVAPSIVPTISPSSILTKYNYIFKVAGASTSATLSSGTGGKATAANFVGPKGLYMDTTGIMYVGDESSHCYRYFDSDGD